MLPDFADLIVRLVDAEVEFVVIGGVSMVLHGSPRVTRDLDVCYARSPANLARLARALEPLRPTLRDAPADLPFVLDAPALKTGLNFTLDTTAGAVDLLGEVPGLGAYEVVRRLSAPMTVYDRQVLVLSLDGLERAKRAAGRLKDVLDLAEILEIRRLRKL